MENHDVRAQDGSKAPLATFTPLASLSGTVVSEIDYADLFWKRLQWFGAHEDVEICWSWARLQESRDPGEGRLLWGLLGQYGATQDHVLRDIWKELKPYPEHPTAQG